MAQESKNSRLLDEIHIDDLEDDNKTSCDMTGGNKQSTAD